MLVKIRTCIPVGVSRRDKPGGSYASGFASLALVETVVGAFPNLWHSHGGEPAWPLDYRSLGTCDPNTA